jgi:probable rRNA maturation factor
LANALESAKPEVSILLLDDAGIAALNGQYRGKPQPTDVLSFPLYTAEELAGIQPDVLGDVVISLETAARQAERTRCALWEEMTRLLIHGVLHLLGHDHEQGPAAARAMRARERRLLKEVLADSRIAAVLH